MTPNHLCPTCSKPILAGSTITALNQTWHADCFRCAACGKPIGQERFFAHDDRPYHGACYHARFSPRCGLCGQPVTDGGVVALGKTWHRTHFLCAGGQEPLPGSFFEKDGRAYCERHYQERFGRRCAADGALIGQSRYFEKEGKTYCEAHYWQKFGKRCAIGGEILKESYSINAWGDTYCSAHQRGLADCFSCGRPICERLTGGGQTYTDGRTMCNRCQRSAVDAAPVGQGILQEVRTFLARQGLDIGPAATPLRLASQDELTRRSTKPYAHKPTGMACHQSTTRNGQVVERQVEAILILFGLPREHFAAVAAHELMHTYLFMNSFPPLEPVVEEGLCELAKYLWLQQRKSAEAAYHRGIMETNQNPVYGRGFQLARQSLERSSLLVVLNYVHRFARFP